MTLKQILILLASGTLALSQTPSIPSVASMTPELMDEAINESYQKRKDVETPRAIVKEAVDLGRLDLMRACFLNGHVSGDVRRAIVALPDNELRRKAAIMMLHNPSSLWPVDEMVASSGVPATGMIEPLISTVPSLLPGETLKKEMVITPEARHKLAGRLLAALIAQGTVISAEEKAILEAPPEAAPKQPVAEASTTAQPATGQVQPTTPAKSSSNTPVSTQADTIPRYFLWLGGGALAVIAMGWIAWKKRRKA